MLKKWHKGMTTSNVTLEQASSWVLIWGALFGMISPQVAIEVGNRLGVVEEVERRKMREVQNFFMRVRVALPISKPQQLGSYIADSSGERTWVSFKNERLPIFCHFLWTAWTWCMSLCESFCYREEYEARVRFGTRVRVRVRVRDSAIFEKGGCGCGRTRRLKNY